MSAIKKYFNRSREIELRREERRVQRRIQREKERQEKAEQLKREYEEEYSAVDTALRIQDFTDEEKIVEYVWEQYDDVFNKIMENINTYPDHVQQALNNAFNRQTFATGKIKLVELTDDDMDRIETQKQKEFDTKFEAEWNTYKKERGLTRPESEADEKYTELYDKLQKAKKDLEDEQKKPSPNKRYVPPAMRGKVSEPDNPEVEKIKKRIQDIENEIAKVKKEIQQEEYNWENDKRKEATTYLINKVFGM